MGRRILVDNCVGLIKRRAILIESANIRKDHGQPEIEHEGIKQRDRKIATPKQLSIPIVNASTDRDKSNEDSGCGRYGTGPGKRVDSRCNSVTLVRHDRSLLERLSHYDLPFFKDNRLLSFSRRFVLELFDKAIDNIRILIS